MSKAEARDSRKAAIAALQHTIGYHFRDAELLDRALTHASVGGGTAKVRHNERLEFLGDRVLGLVAAERMFVMDAAIREGEMTQRFHKLTNGKACAVIARRMGIAPALRLAPGESKSGGRDSDTILGDACEALLAAIYIDGGLHPARAVFLKFWAEDLAAVEHITTKDPKNQLQEWSQARGLGIPQYELIDRTGPDHAPCFVVGVHIEGFRPESGEGRSLAAAEKAAAQQMLMKRESDQ